ncbi:MAG: ABC transporter substrate-binding protein [Bacillota bacterium]|jgi:peptide/nickel transport system substrate-binding protein|nr:ABC transporter substrate-binding protein [Bacillota bacterium]HHT90960.1 ABC transporter substrate-binding protein [Bacillota bacterium]
MNTTRKVLLFVCLSILVFSVTVFAATSTGLPRDKTLIVNMLTGRVGTPGNFNAWVGWRWSDRGLQNLVNEPLWSVDFATGKIVNGLASGDPVYNEDFTKLTIPLREGVAWNDGTPFTADDVVFTVEALIAEPGFSNHPTFSTAVDAVYKNGDYEVVFELKESNSRFHTHFLDRWGCTWIMPKHIFAEVDDVVSFEFNPFIGCGPYKLHSYDPSGYWTIWEKRDDWDKSPTGILFGEPVPQYVLFQTYNDESAKIVAQLTHQLDVADLSAEAFVAAMAQGETIRAYQPHFPWVVNNDPCITGIIFNTMLEPYDNKEVRWALLLAMDIVEYLAQAVDGQATLSPIHIPSLGAYPEFYIEPMQDWLQDFALDLGDGELFYPYDPDAGLRVAEYARQRGHQVSEDMDEVKATFGLGWYKYAPDVAERLLEKNGFSRDAKGNWLLPDGTQWKIQVTDIHDTAHHQFKNGNAAVQQWKKFGIEAEYIATDAYSELQQRGDFQVGSVWPAPEPWGAGVDLYRVLDDFYSEYMAPIGELNRGHGSRWSSPEFDAIIRRMRATDPTDIEATVAVSTEALKILIEEMPSIPTYGYAGFLTWDEYYWTNWPGSENPYAGPYGHWGTLKYMLPFLQPTGNQ